MRMMTKAACLSSALLLSVAQSAFAAQGVGTGMAPSGTSNGNSASANSKSSTSATGGTTDETKGTTGSGMSGRMPMQAPTGSGAAGTMTPGR